MPFTPGLISTPSRSPQSRNAPSPMSVTGLPPSVVGVVRRPVAGDTPVITALS